MVSAIWADEGGRIPGDVLATLPLPAADILPMRDTLTWFAYFSVTQPRWERLDSVQVWVDWTGVHEFGDGWTSHELTLDCTSSCRLTSVGPTAQGH